MSSGPGERAVPFHCPYCGGTDLRPDAADGSALPHGSWRCGGCRRSYSLRLAPSARSATSTRPTREVS